MSDTSKSSANVASREAELSNNVSRLFDQGRVKDAILLLRKHAAGQTTVLMRLDALEQTYGMMLRYFLQGQPDDSRSRLLGDMRAEMMAMADRTQRASLLTTAPEVYYAENRIISYRPRSLQGMLEDYDQMSARISLTPEFDPTFAGVLKEREELLDNIFLYTWTLGFDAETDLKLLRDAAVSSETIDNMLAPQIVSGLFMALNTWFDSQKLLSLLSIYESASTEQLAARALTAIVLILARWPERVRADRKLMVRLEAMRDSLLSYRRLREVIRTLIRTRDTDRISDKMRSQVLPEMMKLGPEMLRKMKEATSDSDLESLEENPEWEELLQKNGLADKLRELSELQMDGADVMMVAFSNLKTFPFFGRISHWFLPFTTQFSGFRSGPVAELLGSGSPLSGLLEMEGMMCDSDKYSFLLAVATMPEERRRAMSMQLEAQRAQMAETMPQIRKGSGRPEFDVEAEKYARDLYRFFKLSPKKGEFADPFLNPLDFLSLPVVGGILDELEVLELVAEFYFKRGYYSEAAPMLRILAEDKGDNGHFWQKLGYSIEKSGGDLQEALACYMKAELFSPDSEWLQRRLGLLYKRLGQLQLAQDYLERAIGETEQNADLLLLAEICSERKDSKGALRYLYKADYVNPGDPAVIRRIAEYELDAGNYQKALDKLSKLPETQVSEDDRRLRGHLNFLLRRFSEAAEAYRTTIRREQTRREWKRPILDAMPRLEAHGGHREDMLLLLDSLL